MRCSALGTYTYQAWPWSWCRGRSMKHRDLSYPRATPIRDGASRCFLFFIFGPGSQQSTKLDPRSMKVWPTFD